MNVECTEPVAGIANADAGPPPDGAVCSSTGIGDRCNPAHPPYTGGASCGADAGCFEGYATYIETGSAQCRTGACMVYQWNEEIDLAAQSQRVFCTCRCGGPETGTGRLCTCADGFTCATTFLAGEPGIQGAYCVRNTLVPGRDAGR